MYTVAETNAEFLITDRVLVRFRPGTPVEAIDALAARYGLITVEVYSPTERLFQLTDHSGMNPVKLVVALTEQEPSVELAENDINQRMQRRALAAPTEPLYKRAWHLNGNLVAEGVDARASSRCAEAWHRLGSFGSPGVVIAISDDGCRLDHPDFNGLDKFADWGYFRGTRLVRRGDPDGQPGHMYEMGSNHGTSCAGVSAGEADGTFTVGAAPACRLLPIKWESQGPSLFISDSKLRSVLDFIADKADVMSNSWGTVPMNLLARTVVDRIVDLAVRGGRRGKGIVFLWAAGNENCPIQLDTAVEVPYTDGWDPSGRHWIGVQKSKRFRNTLAGAPGVMHVAAMSSGARRSHYSNYGPGIDIAAPSSNSHAYWRMSLPGLGIVAPTGQGSGYELQFGGTSSATPLVAGVAALVISANPQLSAAQVISILRRSASKELDFSVYPRTPQAPFDPDTSWDVSPIAPYDGGEFVDIGHADGTWSPWFGFGKVDAERAVALAVAAAPGAAEVLAQGQPELEIPDNDARGIEDQLTVSAVGRVQSVRLTVDIEHPYIGDLAVTLIAPAGARARVHYRSGGGRANLRSEWQSSTSVALAALRGMPAGGIWRLQVSDLAAADIGKLHSWRLELSVA
jgi:subtilisin-like proprotein convertase family protein/subtilisin family serine protease